MTRHDGKHDVTKYYNSPAQANLLVAANVLSILMITLSKELPFYKVLIDRVFIRF